MEQMFLSEVRNHLMAICHLIKLHSSSFLFFFPAITINGSFQIITRKWPETTIWFRCSLNYEEKEKNTPGTRVGPGFRNWTCAHASRLDQLHDNFFHALNIWKDYVPMHDKIFPRHVKIKTWSVLMCHVSCVITNTWQEWYWYFKYFTNVINVKILSAEMIS